MPSENNVVVVIPVYKRQPDNGELIALRQALKIFQKRSFAIACPKDLDIAVYESTFADGGCGVFIARFDNSFFQSIEGYNRLLLSPRFYTRFKTWKYMLVYQLDCFVIKDDLDRWTNGRYDYVGAPWIDNQRTMNFYQSLNYSRWRWISIVKQSVDFNKGEKIFVGNGGFSLRHIRTFKTISRILSIFFFRQLAGHVNEDYIWSILVTKYFRNFTVPSPSMASHFGLEKIQHEVNLDNTDKLPMGVHAWERYYPELWKALVMKFHC